ncbi:MAG: hypothetical protein QG563_540 [Patescibacteria group bacterium]|nr:hypothetical protein [Patescibacteria group bacterium]
MKKQELVLIVSKLCTKNGNYKFVIKTNIPTIMPHAVYLSSTEVIPEMDSKEYSSIENRLKGTMEIIFFSARSAMQTIGILSYKLIFSDKCIAKGFISTNNSKNMETIEEMTLPISTSEALLVFRSIPSSI